VITTFVSVMLLEENDVINIMKEIRGIQESRNEFDEEFGEENRGIISPYLLPGQNSACDCIMRRLPSAEYISF
jgi:hypothetical protein